MLECLSKSCPCIPWKHCVVVWEEFGCIEIFFFSVLSCLHLSSWLSTVLFFSCAFLFIFESTSFPLKITFPYEVPSNPKGRKSLQHSTPPALPEGFQRDLGPLPPWAVPHPAASPAHCREQHPKLPPACPAAGPFSPYTCVWMYSWLWVHRMNSRASKGKGT